MNDHLKAFMEATTKADSACRDLVRDDLKKLIPLAEQDKAIAAERLHRAYGELQKQRAPIAELEKEVAEAETRSREWAEAHVSDDLGARVAAKVWHQQFTDEVARLRDRLSALLTTIGPYEQAHVKAKQEYAEASLKAGQLNANLLDPYIAYGQQTQAYKTYRCGYGSIVRILTMTNEGSFEWGSAVAFLHELAALAGYDLVENSDRLRKADHDELLRTVREKAAADTRTELRVGKLGVEESPTEKVTIMQNHRYEQTRFVPDRSALKLPYKE